MSGKHNIVIVEDDGILQMVLLNGIPHGFEHIDVDPQSYDGHCPCCRYPLIMGEKSKQDVCTNCGWRNAMSHFDSARHKLEWEITKEEKR